MGTPKKPTPKKKAPKKPAKLDLYYEPTGLTSVAGEWVAVYEDDGDLVREPVACWALATMFETADQPVGTAVVGMVADDDEQALDCAPNASNFLRYERLDWSHEHNRPVRLQAVPDQGDEE